MKAILVLNDMPEDCGECLIYNSSEMLCCGCKVSSKEINAKPKWCPLKPMPQREKYKSIGRDQTHYAWQMERHEDIGWNACLDTIEGD